MRDEPAADAAGLPPLLVLHGFPTNSYDFATVLDALAARRRVILPDFVGFGLSAKPDHRYGIRGAADTIEGVLTVVLTSPPSLAVGRSHGSMPGRR